MSKTLIWFHWWCQHKNRHRRVSTNQPHGLYILTSCIYYDFYAFSLHSPLFGRTMARLNLKPEGSIMHTDGKSPRRDAVASVVAEALEQSDVINVRTIAAEVQTRFAQLAIAARDIEAIVLQIAERHSVAVKFDPPNRQASGLCDIVRPHNQSPPLMDMPLSE